MAISTPSSLFILTFAGYVAMSAPNATAASSGMVLIQAKGLSFQMGMGSIRTKPGEPANGWAFYLGKHKVTFTYDFMMDTVMATQADYLELMKHNPSGNLGDMNLPVERVTWYDAVLYCNARSKRDRLDTVYTYSSVTRNGKTATALGNLAFDIRKPGYRIPTSAEYEYAERAGTTGKWFFAPDGKNVDARGAEVAWWTGNSERKTHPVGTRKPNPWGLYDMVGNLFEWCNDWNAPYSTADQIDPVGAASSPDNNKVAKGGSFKTDIAGHMRIAYHYKWGPGSQATLGAYGGIGEIGFRTVRTVTGASGLISPPSPPDRGIRTLRAQGGRLTLEGAGRYFQWGRVEKAVDGRTRILAAP